MSTIFTTKAGTNSFSEDTSFVFCKGAPESVLHHCASYLAPSQTDQDILSFLDICPNKAFDDEFVDRISKKSAQMASGGLRVLALAIRRVSLNEANNIIHSNKSNSAESDLIFVGLIGLIDPPKQGVKESIRICKQAGIRVIMITGTYILTQVTTLIRQMQLQNSSEL